MLEEEPYALGRGEVSVKSSRTGVEASGLPTALGSSVRWVDERAGLLERERELERIAGALADAAHGVGNVLLVEGPAGIGKTTLGLAATDEARSRGMRVLRAAGRELERDFPYGVVRQLFDPLLRAAAPTDRERLLEGAGTASAA